MTSHRTRLLLLCVTLALSVAALCACTPVTQTATPAAEDAQVLLGFSQLGSESAWRLGNTKSVQDAAKRAGVRLMYENAEQKQECGSRPSARLSPIRWM